MVTIPGYQINEQIYKDKSYAMYRGVRENDEQPVFLKRSHIDDSSHSLLNQYINEYAVLQLIKGDGIVRTLDLVDTQDTITLVYEDMGAIFLNVFLEKNSLSIGESLVIAIKLAEALEYVHDKKYIHKRINPTNILCQKDPRVIQLINFELATELITDQMYSDGSEVSQKSMAYIAPEQTGKLNRPLGYRSDLYSLGSTFYEIFSGKPVFESRDVLEIIHSHIAITPKSPDTVNPLVPKPLADIIMKLLAKEAQDRYLSAAGLKHDLKICLDQYIRTGRIEPFELQKRDVTDQFRISGKLYGRKEEINVLKTTFTRVQKGSLELVIVSGGAGIGKSSLVHETLQQVTTDITKTAIHLGIGRFDQFHKDIPYSAVVQAVRDVVRQILVKSDNEVEAWRNKIKKTLGPNGGVVTDIIPELEVILGPQNKAPQLEPLEARNRLNLVFQNFFRTLGSPDYPVVIFLDDVQYADPASLQLVETILSDDGLNHFMGIVAYRDDEASSDHHIHEMLEALKTKKVRTTQLRLASLGLESVKLLIADSINTDKNRVTDLGALTLQKTDGNPFFLDLFLKTLSSENLLTFDIERNQWQWSISQINLLDITDNAADLLIRKIHRLGKSTQEMLGWASCIGIEFNLSDLISISKKASHKIENFLREGVTEGVLLPIEPISRQAKRSIAPNQTLIQGLYRFAHDRIRQAVYNSLAADKKRHYHSEIGHHLLQNLSNSQKKERLFEIVDHLNVGNDLEIQVTKEDKLAHLNYKAGMKAKSSAAFLPAFNYLQHGIRILCSDCWENNYEFTKTLYNRAAEMAYLCGNYDQMDRLSGKVIEHAHSFLDTINVYESIINSHIARYQMKDAISIAIDVLKRLNVRLPDKASKWKLFKGYLGTKSTLAWRDVEDLANLKNMTDPTKVAAIQILTRAASASYFTDQHLLALVTFKSVQLSKKYGNAPESAISYAAYGLILCSVMDDIDAGFEFGQLALKILKQFDVKRLESRVGYLVSAFIAHWKNHIRGTLSPLKKIYRTGLETGDFEYAGYGAVSFCYHSFFAGIELPEVERRITRYKEAIDRFKHDFSYTFLQIYHQCIVNLKDQVDDPCRLSGTYYDEHQKLPLHQEANDKTTLANVYLVKLYTNYLFGKYSEAAEYAKYVKKYLDGMSGSIGIPLYYFYDSLSLLSLYQEAEVQEQSKILKIVSDNKKKMKIWATHAPMNHQHKIDLVEAERLAVSGSKKEAEIFYKQAVTLARKHGYRNEEALILERTAIFYSNTGQNQQAADTMIMARSIYEKWGAIAKVRALDRDFTFLLIDRHPPTPIEKGTSTDNLNRQQSIIRKDLDMAAVMKATQAISREIVLEKLLDQLMRIIIENAGAQRGLLILKREEGLFVKASVEADSDEVNANQSLPVEESDALSLDIVRYVERTGEPLVIHKAADDNQFYTDLHILEHRPKSILCMPILLKEKTTGVLYLENNLTSNVFTKERVKILNILLAQAAISLENALLYESLQTEVTVRKNAEERLLHLATALEQAAEGILITEMDGTITYANPACEEIFGYNQDEIRGKNTRLLRSGLQGDTFFRNVWRTLSSGEIWSGRMSSKKKDDTINELEVTVSPIRDDEGNISSYVSVSRDVTREIKMEKELRQAQKMEAMGTLAGGIAHDFNNILAAIMGYTELATFQSPPESPIHQNLERVITSTRRAKDLVRQILAFSRQTDQEARPIQLKLIINEALKMLRASLPSTIEMRKDIENALGYVEADPTQIHQVVMNLCTNAAQAMEGGGVLSVNLDDYTIDKVNHHLYPEVVPGKFLRLMVVDDGEGINQSIIERVFEPFFTTKEPGKGTGMGLAMVHGIIKRCEGAIRVESKPGEGTTIQVLFPRYHGALSEDEEPTTSEIVPGRERIMFVDDEKALVTLVEEGLQRIGYNVHLETDSNKALNVFEKNPEKFDLVITDQTMPKLTGMELSRKMIQIRPDIPIILYSGLMDEITADMIDAVGIRSFLSKPLMLKQLSEAIRQVLDSPEEIGAN